MLFDCKQHRFNPPPDVPLSLFYWSLNFCEDPMHKVEI